MCVYIARLVSHLYEEESDLLAERAMYLRNDSPGPRFEWREEITERGRRRERENISYYFVLWSNENARATCRRLQFEDYANETCTLFCKEYIYLYL